MTFEGLISRTRQIALVSILSVSFYHAQASAAFFTGNDVFPFCSQNKQMIYGFVAGVFDKAEIDNIALMTFWAESTDPKLPAELRVKADTSFLKNGSAVKQFCEPTGKILLSQIGDIFCQYLAKTPADRHQVAAKLLNDALTDAWPCPLAK